MKALYYVCHILGILIMLLQGVLILAAVLQPKPFFEPGVETAFNVGKVIGLLLISVLGIPCLIVAYWLNKKLKKKQLHQQYDKYLS